MTWGSRLITHNRTGHAIAWAASASFLVLTGIRLAFLMDRRARQGFGAAARWAWALRRALVFARKQLAAAAETIDATAVE